MESKARFIKAKSKIVPAELGLFAATPILAGTFMFYTFKRFDNKRRPSFEEDYFQTPINALVNHSDHPNTHTIYHKDFNLVRVASRNIAAGEEITSNYQQSIDLIKSLGYTMKQNWLWFKL